MTGSPGAAAAEPLDALFFPRTVGILGYSATAGRWGRRLVDTALGGGFDGELVAVRPRSEPVGIGRVESLDGIDLLVVAVPADDVPDAVAEAREHGVGAAVVISAGFAETGEAGAELQRRVVEAAGPMPVLGPNCVGLVSGPARLRLTVNSRMESRTAPIRGPVAVVSQSGAVGLVLCQALDSRGVGWSYYVSTGNEAALGLGDIGRYLLRREDIQALALYVESLRDIEGYRELGREAASLGKRVIVLKAGVSESSQRAALSHTAAVAGDFLLFRGVSEAEGIVVVRDEEELVEAAYAAVAPLVLPPRPRLGVVTVSGGVGALLADQVADTGCVLPPLEEATRLALSESCPGLASIANPVDLSGTYPVERESIAALLDVLDAASEIDAIAFCYVHGEQYTKTFAAVVEHLASLRKPAWFLWVGGDVAALEEETPTGMVFDSVPRFARMFRRLPAAFEAPVELPAHGDVEVDLGSWAGARAGVRTEREVAPLLRSHGVRYPATVVAETAEAVVPAVEKAGLAPPWVLKVDSPHAPHRGKLGLVELGLTSAAELAAAVGRMRAAMTSMSEVAATATFMVQEQLDPGVAEFSVGLVRDPQFGPMLIVGPGGRAVEAAGERFATPVPVTPAALRRLHTFLADALRIGVDEHDLGRLASAVSWLARDPRVVEVDVNPVIADEHGGLCAVDSLVVVE
ncbi:acetate--CoA ligase family protein [Nonomuraea wenchangensis]|uniref:acetate--CoA ligase family protein n=1 Tax=Nonomuraea wenchangensis TaxID=568860 RepID=UPI0034317C11